MSDIDWPTLFDEIADEPAFHAKASHVQRITTDQMCGHIVLTGSPERDEPHGRHVAFADLGSVLHLWSGQGCMIDVARARELADALNWWADRKERLDGAA